ncbi:MAG TPA: hypothetical protein VNL77_22395 [Roseiflexaceae bacterium]|nr:hypothetical protein [Roseiflexaceae bacterium]
MTTKDKVKPWQRHTLRAPRTVYAIDVPADVTLHLWRGGHTMITVIADDGRVRQHPISPDGVQAALAGLPSSSGLLPRDTLGTGWVQGRPFMVRYIPPRPAKLLCQPDSSKPPLVFPIQTPPLIWAALGQEYRIYALATPDYPDSDRVPLCHAPFPNVYDNGGICWGTADKPRTPTLENMLALFLEGSYFSTHLNSDRSRAFGRNIAERYRSLSPETPYPLDDLKPTGKTLGWLLAGGAWSVSGGFAA